MQGRNVASQGLRAGTSDGKWGQLLVNRNLEDGMRRVLKACFALVGFLVLFFGAVQTADAGCELVKVTSSAASKAAAARAAYATAIQTAEEVRRRRGWRYVSMRPRKVKPDPFWKAVRPVVTPDMLLKPDVVTRKTYSQCWKGVVKPYVCTAGSMACGN
jgi:hypothetical protein